MNAFLGRKNISDLEHGLMLIEKKLQALYLKSQKGWARFQEILSVCQTEKDYWDREAVHQELYDLCHILYEGTGINSAATNSEDLEEAARSFMWDEDQEGLKIDWDFLYSINPSFKKDPPKKTSPLYPEDVFGLLILLDRQILFYRESYRRLKYELIQKRINLI